MAEVWFYPPHTEVTVSKRHRGTIETVLIHSGSMDSLSVDYLVTYFDGEERQTRRVNDFYVASAEQPMHLQTPALGRKYDSPNEL
jgi:hypothetical protein